MKRQMWSIRIPVLALIVASGGMPADLESQADLKTQLLRLRAAVEALQGEVTSLRSTLLSMQLERHREAIRHIESELGGVIAQRTRLAELDQARQQDLHDVEELLARTDPEAEDRSHGEAVRGELAVSRVKEIREESEAVAARERELLRRLNVEQQAARLLEEVWKNRKGNTQ